MNKQESDIWPQRGRFILLLKNYQKITGYNQQTVARELGISLSHLRNCLYRPDKHFGFDVLHRAAALFGCSITEFLDDPGEGRLGIPVGASEEERVFLRQIAEDIANLNTPQLRHAMAFWSEMIRFVKVPK